MLLRPRKLFASVFASATVALVAGALASGTGAAVSAGALYHPVISLAAHSAEANSSVQSNNWSGYDKGLVDTGGLAQSISGQWTIPTATQKVSGQAESSATWIGIGGGCVDMASGCSVTDPSLIQAGTEQDVSATGQASYSAWWEILPVPSITASVAVNPGDRVSVSITSTLPEVWTINFADESDGQSFSQTIPYTSTMDSAEWIEEAPVVVSTSGATSAGEAALPNLSAADFDLATLNGKNPGFTSADEIQMVSSSGSVLATPSGPDSDTDGFNVCTYSTSC